MQSLIKDFYSDIEICSCCDGLVFADPGGAILLAAMVDIFNGPNPSTDDAWESTSDWGSRHDESNKDSIHSESSVQQEKEKKHEKSTMDGSSFIFGLADTSDYGRRATGT